MSKPQGVTVSSDEWEWFCFRTKHTRSERLRRLEEAKDKPKAPSGATAGWRKP